VLSPEELQAVASRTLIMFSDHDLMSLEHAVAMYDAIPDAELAIVPGTSHFLLQEKRALCNAIILDFLTNEPVEKVAPIRRASGGPAGGTTRAS
jgi:pimeloyl-ACP methyl ester carboxylesterase